MQFGQRNEASLVVSHSKGHCRIIVVFNCLLYECGNTIDDGFEYGESPRQQVGYHAEILSQS